MKTENHVFLVKTNKDVEEWMDSFYIDGHKADFRLHCQWAWQEQERRHTAVRAKLIAALEMAKPYVGQEGSDAELLQLEAVLASAK